MFLNTIDNQAMTKNMVGKWKGIVFLTQSVSKLSRNRLEKEKNELKIT